MEANEVQAIAEAVGKAVVTALGPDKTPVANPNDAPEGAFFDEETQEVIYTDPAVKAADEAEMDCLKALPKGTICVRGRSGSQTVNHTEESMNFLNDFRKNKKSWKTRFNNR